jgi:[methyl-Co(III) methanol-specific corrinoid protein]:coenzyme M methyltransferase
MVRLALAMQEATGFDNIALPFCMTIEAERYGAQIDFGNATTQPRVRGTLLAADHPGDLPRPDFRTGRAGVLLNALRRARAERPDIALIGNMVGPFSILGMLADPLKVLRLTRTRPEIIERRLGEITSGLIEFGKLQRESGADVLCIAEPTATGEILGSRLFSRFGLPHLNRLVRELRPSGARLIIHICGDVRRIEAELLQLQADALSFDSMVNLCALRQKDPPWQVMGNVNCFLLHDGPEAAVRHYCGKLKECGIRLIAPACGVIPTTPVSNLRVMRDAVA